MLIDAGNRIWTCGEADGGQLGRAIEKKPAGAKPDDDGAAEGEAVKEGDSKQFCARLKLAHTLPEGFDPKTVKAGHGHTVVLGHCGTVLSFGHGAVGQRGARRYQDGTGDGTSDPAALQNWTVRQGLVSRIAVWDRTTVLFVLNQAIDLRQGGVIDSAFSCDADTLTVLGRNPVENSASAGHVLNDSRDHGDGGDEEESTLFAATFPLVDNSLCVVHSFSGTSVSATYDSGYKELWAFDAEDGRVRRHHGLGAGQCSAMALPATLPLAPGAVAAPSNVGLALTSLVGMAIHLPGDAPMLGSHRYHAAQRFKAHKSKNWHVSGAPDAVALEASQNVTLVGVGLYGKGLSTYDVKVDVHSKSSIAIGTPVGSTEASQMFTGMSNAPGSDWYPCVLDTPVDMVAGRSYDIVATITGTGGASESCSGSNGAQTIIGPDGTTFIIRYVPHCNSLLYVSRCTLQSS